jgi:hypothetical protein
MLHARIRKFFLQQYLPLATKMARRRDCPQSADFVEKAGV